MNLINVFQKVMNFLNKEKFEYLVIGGIAAGVIGEPRATGDIDIDIILDKDNIDIFLKKARKAGFVFSGNECIKKAGETGTFQIKLGNYHIDFIIASIELETDAIKRRKIIKIYNVNANFPTPEDLILLKVVPARPKDIIDAENIAIKYHGRLDKKYMLNQAQKISEEAENFSIYREVERLLKIK